MGERYLTHQEAVGLLYQRLTDYLARQRVGHAFFAPADVIFSPRRAVQPDVLVLPLINGCRPEAFREVQRLLVAAEVLSRISHRCSARSDRWGTVGFTSSILNEQVGATNGAFLAGA